jgi:hypothetical protein
MPPTWMNIAEEYYDDMNRNVKLSDIVTYMFEIVPDSDRDREAIAKAIFEYAQDHSWGLENDCYASGE